MQQHLLKTMYDEEKAHIDALLFRQYLGQLNEAEVEELNRLLNEYPEARAMQQAMEQKISEGILHTQPTAQDTSAKWERLSPQLGQIRRRQTIRRAVWMAAASMLVAFAGTSIYYITQSHTTTQQRISKTAGQTNATTIQLRLANGREYNLTNADDQIIKAGNAQLRASKESLELSPTSTRATGWNELRVPAKLDYAITLPDGSKVRLNASTKLKFPFSFNYSNREVFVDGEAYFTIAANAKQPFIVHTPHADIQVLGTEFNVNTYNKGTVKTALVSGSVAVKAQGSKTLLQPGKEAIVILGKGISQEAFESKVTLSWMKGIFFFHDAPIEDIAAMIERWYDVPVVIDDPELGKVTFTGHLDKHKELDLFLTVLSNTGDIHYRYEGHKLHLSK